MCGDSTSVDAVDKLMQGQKADMVFTDPPYGYSYVSNYQDKHEMLLNDDVMLDFFPVAYASMNDNGAIFVCGSHQTIHYWRPMVEAHFSYKNLIVWKKNNWSMGDLSGAFAGQHELIIFAHKGRIELRGERSRDVWEFDRDPPKHHPTQKPVDLIKFAATKTTDEGDIVLDLFGGSGSTLIACEKTGRSCRMMELDPKYCDVIVKRWEEFTGQKARLENAAEIST
jgi:DNA modification methylase